MKKATFIILLLTSIITQAQQLFKGKVTTASNHPLSGATITVSSGPSVSTTSDQNGEFSLEVTKNTEILINYIGYTSKKIVLTASYTQIVLEEEMLHKPQAFRTILTIMAIEVTEETLR